MSIDFTLQRWEKIKADARAWWAGELDRPLLQITVEGRDPGRPEPPVPNFGWDVVRGLSAPADAIVDRWDWDLSKIRYLGDAFPTFWPNFGAGVAAAFMGAELEPGEDTIWFHAPSTTSIADLRLQYDPSNVWLARIKELCQASMDRWQGLVQVDMTDLGGAIDILSTFRPSEALLMDLYDHPDEVKRLTWDLHNLWWRYFDEIDAVLRPTNPGFTAWTPVFSEAPYYILQCDFAYMIGPAMFDEFVKPELAASCKRLGNAFYHLDGPGQLPHLDSLLSIPELKGVQWIPGAGAPDYAHWPEVYRKIRDAGKLIQLFGDIDLLDAIVDQLGSAKGIVLIGSAPSEQDARAWVRKYGADL